METQIFRKFSSVTVTVIAFAFSWFWAWLGDRVVSPAEVVAFIVVESLGKLFSALETRVVFFPGVVVLLSQFSVPIRAPIGSSKCSFSLLHFILEVHAAALQESVAKISALHLIGSHFGSDLANCLLRIFFLLPQLVVLFAKVVTAVTKLSTVAITFKCAAVGTWPGWLHRAAKAWESSSDIWALLLFIDGLDVCGHFLRFSCSGDFWGVLLLIDFLDVGGNLSLDCLFFLFCSSLLDDLLDSLSSDFLGNFFSSVSDRIGHSFHS